MKLAWNNDELLEHWAFLPDERQWIAGKTSVNQLGFTVMLKFFQSRGDSLRGARKSPPPQSISSLSKSASHPNNGTITGGKGATSRTIGHESES